MHARRCCAARWLALRATPSSLRWPGAPPLGAASVPVGRTTEPVRAIMLRLTQLFNITGHPAIAIPCGNGADGLPRSLQLVGHRGATDRLLEVAAAVERQMAGGDGSVGGGPG